MQKHIVVTTIKLKDFLVTSKDPPQFKTKFTIINCRFCLQELSGAVDKGDHAYDVLTGNHQACDVS